MSQDSDKSCSTLRTVLAENSGTKIKKGARFSDGLGVIAMRFTAVVGFTLAVFVFQASHAAELSERGQSLRRAARNQLGVLEFCQSQGLASEGAVAAQRRSIANPPLVTTSNLGEQEEQDGRLGYLAFNGRQALFADSFTAQGLTLTTACEGRVALALAGR